MSRLLPALYALFGLSLIFFGSSCSSQPARLKPGKFDLVFSIAPALVGGSVQVDLIGASARSYLPNLETISLSQYWSPDNAVRRDVPKATIVFGAGSPSVQKFPASDPKWTSWLSAGAEFLVLMVDSPGMPSRLIVPLDQREWGKVPALEFLIQESGIRLVTARPVK